MLETLLAFLLSFMPASDRADYTEDFFRGNVQVSALRAVAIPARQVYTPRWAHTDDNHAWVEAWVDGEWSFLGACEPEPVLNLGWFNAPASRGLLMHTKVFGDWHGPEEVMSRTHQYTEINVISNYAQCATATVEVQDIDGHPVVGADVKLMKKILSSLALSACLLPTFAQQLPWDNASTEPYIPTAENLAEREAFQNIDRIIKLN